MAKELLRRKIIDADANTTFNVPLLQELKDSYHSAVEAFNFTEVSYLSWDNFSNLVISPEVEILPRHILNLPDFLGYISEEELGKVNEVNGMNIPTTTDNLMLSPLSFLSPNLAYPNVPSFRRGQKCFLRC